VSFTTTREFSSKGVVGGEKENERASGSGVAAAVAGEEKTDGHVLCAPLAKDHPLSRVSHARQPIFDFPDVHVVVGRKEEG
jgi:hypothetical protein